MCMHGERINERYTITYSGLTRVYCIASKLHCPGGGWTQAQLIDNNLNFYRSEVKMYVTL